MKEIDETFVELPEEPAADPVVQQVDGADDSDENEDEDDFERPSIFTIQDYLSVESSLPPQGPDFSTTQDYMDAMSEDSCSQGQNGSGDALESIDVDDDVPPTIKYVKATVTLCEGRRVFSVGEEGAEEKEYCLFPHAHQDLRELREHGTYRGGVIGSLLPAPLHTGTRAGSRQAGINVVLNSEEIIKSVQLKVVDLMKHLKTELGCKVFKPAVVAIIQRTRTILDLQSLLKKLVSRSPADLANILFGEFRAASVVIEPNLFTEVVDEAEYRMQYREYLRKLKSMLDDEPNVMKLDSLSVLTKMFAGDFSKNIEAIMGILARAMVTVGVESVVECWVSVMEAHNCQRRPLGEKMIITETSVNLNGPNPVNCDGVVEEAMQLYWSKSKLQNGGDGHSSGEVTR